MATYKDWVAVSQLLKEVIEKHPFFFEAIPPPRRSSATFLDSQLTKLAAHLRRLPHLSAVNIPEVVDENHLGKPFYRTYDPRVFAEMIREHVDVEVVVNKVVVHLPSRGEFLTWAAEALQKHHVHNVVLVGGTSHVRNYPGPSVLEAEGILSHLYHQNGMKEGLTGCITIPSRPGEAEKLFAKTLSGASFATTQILYDSRDMKEFLVQYDRLCHRFSVKPVTILLSFAPLHDSGDLEFVRWLGIDVPETVEEKVLADGDDADQTSIRLALTLYREINLFAKRKRLSVPLGVNVEEVSRHNQDAAFQLAHTISSEH